MGKNNVNPDHYKTAGRERQGEDIVQEIHKQKYTQANADSFRKQRESNFIPGEAPVGEAESTGASSKVTNDEVGQVNESANSSSNS